MLDDFGADINSVHRASGKPGLWWACRTANTDLLRFLLRKGVAIDSWVLTWTLGRYSDPSLMALLEHVGGNVARLGPHPSCVEFVGRCDTPFQVRVFLDMGADPIRIHRRAEVMGALEDWDRSYTIARAKRCMDENRGVSVDHVVVDNLLGMPRELFAEAMSFF